jgi:hypothetical protein
MDYRKEDERHRKDMYRQLKPTLGDNSQEYKMPEKDDNTFFAKRDFQPIIKEVVKEVRVVKKQAIPKMDDEPLMPLKKITPNIVGSIFERVRFLEERIAEVRDAMALREKLHNDILNGIDEDIKEKNSMVLNLSDVDERRNLKMDISLLMKEKRREEIEFWRDVYTLRSELRELTEDYQTEKKISNIFSDLKKDFDKEAGGE